ncbi:START domain containing protein [Trema orientale]|uniref:START domain containing protein n=1 Tax=Trema orientale TaxID=63057 RepID=A0A2P5CJA6_TREOI|nr:START domain containing protein [Trema orientale]
MAVVSVFLEIFRRPTIVEVMGELVLFMTPLWIAVFAGVLVGWAWRPKWANLVGRDMSDCSVSKQESPSSSSSPMSSACFASIPSLNSLKFQLPSCVSWGSDDGIQEKALSVPPAVNSDSGSSQLEGEKSSFVTGEDLQHLYRLVEEKDGGPAWIQMMDRSTPTMGYQAWRRDPETGPPQYRSRTVFEDATPELVRDFFWDDEFRMKWDDMLIHSSILEECPTTGTMVVQWVRKFPFFCSDREYLIGRRIWESGNSYYCVTKELALAYIIEAFELILGVPYSSVPRRNKPRRVDLYYSSWCIRPVESRRGDGQLTACEVLLFHHEDMGIPWELAKLGVRQGMWGAVKKIDPGLRKYQKAGAAGAPISRCAYLAQINTKVSADYLSSVENACEDSSEIEKHSSSEKQEGKNIPKLLVVGGVVLLACSLDRGLLTKAVIFGVARRFAKIGRRL